MLKAKDIMSTSVITIKKDTPVSEIITVLSRNRISGVPVVNDAEKIVGVVTEADLLYRKKEAISTSEIYKYGDYLDDDSVAAEEKKASAATAEEIMTTVPICVSEYATVEEAVSLMLEKGIKRIFVTVNEQVVGVISKSDILQSTVNDVKPKKRKAPENGQAAGLMTKDVITVKKDTDVSEVIRILIENRISGVPVLDDDGRVVGVVSETDLIYRGKAAYSSASYWTDRAKYIEEHWKTAGTKAGEVMTGDIISAPPGTPAEELADIMLKNKVKRVLIMDGGKLVGIVSRADIISAAD